jgi:hypothetical protein
VTGSLAGELLEASGELDLAAQPLELNLKLRVRKNTEHNIAAGQFLILCWAACKIKCPRLLSTLHERVSIYATLNYANRNKFPIDSLSTATCK